MTPKPRPPKPGRPISSKPKPSRPISNKPRHPGPKPIGGGRPGGRNVGKPGGVVPRPPIGKKPSARGR